MALINCPECDKEISDKSDKCVYCGFPTIKQKNTTCIINGVEYKLSFLLDDEIQRLYKIKQLHLLTECSLKDCTDVVDKILRTQEIPKILNLNKIEDLQKPKCPFCNSTNIKSISGTERAASIVMVGIFSKKINKSFKCLNCSGTF